MNWFNEKIVMKKLEKMNESHFYPTSHILDEAICLQRKGQLTWNILILVEDLIIANGEPEDIYKFAKEIEGASTYRLAEGIIATKDAEFIYLFARDIKGAPINELADGIIATENARFMYLFAKDIEGAPISKLADGIIDILNAEFMYKFARDIEGAPIDRLADGIIATKDAKFIYYFAKEIEGAPIDRLADRIIETGDTVYIYRFLMDVKGAPVDKLIDGLINTNGIWLDMFYGEQGKNCEIEKYLLEKILESNDRYLIVQLASFAEMPPQQKLEYHYRIIEMLEADIMKSKANDAESSNSRKPLKVKVRKRKNDKGKENTANLC